MSPAQADQARDFVECLELLGCKRSEIEYCSYDLTSKRSKHVGFWRRELGLHSSLPITRKAPFNGRRDWGLAHDWHSASFSGWEWQENGECGFSIFDGNGGHCHGYQRQH